MELVATTSMPDNYVTSEMIDTSDELASLLPPDWTLGFPLARIHTCGTPAIEVLIDLQSGPDGRPRAVYGPPASSLLEIKGMTTAFLLLALLASQPHCFAAKDFLMQTLPHVRHASTADEEDALEGDGALKRLDNVVSLLRRLLCPPKLLVSSNANKLRKHLVRYVRATPESGPGYRLAGLPLLWLDVEGMETSIKRARSLEERGEDGLEEWQAVYQIGMRGSFLGHEPYSDWADWRRMRVADLLWQSVSAQWKRAVSREEGPTGTEAAIQLLLDFWQGHQTNEDAFRSLVELLCKQERFQLAEECYRQLCSALDREGRTPHKRTEEKMTFVRTLQIQREHNRRMSALALPSSTSQVVEGTVDHSSEDSHGEVPADRILPETRHLIGREAWLAGVRQMVQGFPAKKLIILQGPIGVGKSSELTRLASSFQRAEGVSYRVIWLPFPAAEWSNGPEATLDVLLGTLLSECGIAPFPSEAPRERLIAALLTHLGKQGHPTVMLLDNAECLLEENGKLAACWEAFLAQFIRSRHQATLLLATKEWHGWPGRESIFVAETFVPPLTHDESVCLLQRLGLQEVSVEQLRAISMRVTGIPLLLEWTAKLVTDPLLLDNWESFNEQESILQPYTTQESLAGRLQKVLDDPSLLGEHLANRLAPLLQRILEKHLSEEARLVLTRLAISTVPLGKPALQILCPRPRLLKELRDASLLTSYTNRVQLLPVVALTVQQYLSFALRQEGEDLVIQAYTRWLDDGNLEMREAGSVVTELAVLLLKHHRLLEAAELLIRCGWISFQWGYGPRLARFAREVMGKIDWHQTVESECAGLVFLETLFPFLGRPIETKEFVDYERICNAFLTGALVLQTATEGYVVDLLILNLMNALHFTEAKAILDVYHLHLKARYVNPENSRSWLQKRAFLLGMWCEYLQETGEIEESQAMREETIRLYQQRVQLLSSRPGHSPLKKKLRTRALGSCFSYLGYHLYRIGQHEEALQIIEQAIALQEQGFGNVGILASSYSDKAQILMELGRFQEAILFDEKAIAEIQRCIDAGDAGSQEDIGTYHVNRGRLYLRVGRVEEAEYLLRKALPHIHEKRRKYRMFAQDGLNEIERWRQQSVTPQHQLDWRWIERYRELCTYDSYWWLTWAGPFTEEEQAQWDQLSALPLDETTKTQLGTLMKESRERELAAALAEQREPSFHYPAIDIVEVQRRIAAHIQLKEEVRYQEPNVIVRRLYEGAIEGELDYLHLIEATYEHNSKKFHEYSLRVFPLPTQEEMRYALTHIERTLAQGLKRADTANLSQRMLAFLQTVLHLSLNPTLDEDVFPEGQQKASSVLPQEIPKVSAKAVKRFFEAILRENGYEGWQVAIDLNATNERVEQGARCLFLREKTYSLAAVKSLFIHEVAGHVARCVSGERSLLGLLGVHTKNHSPTEEGFVLYHERQLATLLGQRWNDSGMRLSTFSIGLAHGIMTPPQTFLSICSFIESFSLLRRLLKHPEIERSIHEKRAQIYAIDHCLRVFRGVPDLTQAGICYPEDAIYLHGLFMVEQAVSEEPTVLDRLAVGKVALELLPDLQELGITTPSLPSLYTRAYAPDLDAYILSFEEPREAPLRGSSGE
jgi:tetratricopeptide (TPR) repeat protein